MSSVESKAVFLSYASQDAEAVKGIAEALRAAGVEVWFDQNELVGGDAWDAKIRGQIASCALFVPVISAATRILAMPVLFANRPSCCWFLPTPLLCLLPPPPPSCDSS